jgi:hypothetical protein
MTRNIFDSKGHQKLKKNIILACRKKVGDDLEAYGLSPAHTLDILKGRWQLAQQISRVKNQAIRQFSEQFVDKLDLAKMQVSREYVVRHLRLWLRRQTEVSGLTTHSLTSIGPNDIPA